MSKTASIQPPAVTRRPWYRLHCSTWLVVVLGLIVGTLLIVPGEEGWYPWEGSLRQERAVVHGWPWLYLWRTPGPWRDDPKASPTFAWNIGDAVKQFRLLPLVADFAAWAVAVAAVIALWEWRRRRSRRFQFSLKSLLLLVTLAAVVLGWWSAQRAADQELRDCLKGFWNTPFAREPVPRFPLWMRVAFGDQSLLPLGINAPPADALYDWEPAKDRYLKPLIERYPSALCICVRNPTEDDLTRFLENRATERLSVECAPDSFFSRLGDLPNLDRLNVSWMTDDALSRLGHVASLRRAVLWGSKAISNRAWGRFAENSDIEVLTLEHMRLTDSSLGCVAAMKRLRELEIIDSPITDQGISSLAGNNRIEELGLTDTFITDEGLSALASMSGLKWLDLSYTAVTDAGVKAIQAARPDLKIKYDSEAPDLADLQAKIDDVKGGKTTYFNAAGWKIQDRHLIDLGKLIRIESLSLRARHLTDATLARVADLRQLKELDITASLMTAGGLQHLTKLAKLRGLSLDDRQIDDESIAVLKKLPALKDLWIKHDLDEADAKRLEARLNAALPREKGYRLHFDGSAYLDPPWD